MHPLDVRQEERGVQLSGKAGVFAIQLVDEDGGFLRIARDGADRLIVGHNRSAGVDIIDYSGSHVRFGRSEDHRRAAELVLAGRALDILHRGVDVAVGLEGFVVLQGQMLDGGGVWRTFGGGRIAGRLFLLLLSRSGRRRLGRGFRGSLLRGCIRRRGGAVLRRRRLRRICGRVGKAIFRQIRGRIPRTVRLGSRRRGGFFGRRGFGRRGGLRHGSPGGFRLDDRFARKAAQGRRPGQHHEEAGRRREGRGVSADYGKPSGRLPVRQELAYTFRR